MKRWMGISGVIAMAVTLAGVTSASVSAQGTHYTVTIENLTGGEFTRGQPFTPPLLAVHSSDADIFTVGEEASEGVQQIAENGNLAPLMEALEGSAAVSDVMVDDGPLMPGASTSFTVEIPEGSRLSWISMLICTNDGFTGIDALEVSGSESVQTDAYDAGTEINTEDFADMVPPCQGLVGVSSGDPGTGMSNHDLAEGGVIHHHEGIEGGMDLVHSHSWNDPVAMVTVAPAMDEAPDDDDDRTPVSPPSTGTGGLAGEATALPYAAAAAVLITALATGGVMLRKRR